MVKNISHHHLVLPFMHSPSFANQRMTHRLRVCCDSLLAEHSLKRSGPARSQGGTCIVIGDAHEWVAEASRLVQERINCTIFPMEAFYRHEGHSQARPPFTLRAGALPAACMPHAVLSASSLQRPPTHRAKAWRGAGHAAGSRTGSAVRADDERGGRRASTACPLRSGASRACACSSTSSSWRTPTK